MYYYGEGVPQNYAEAATRYRQAADQGNAFAQVSLGLMYYYGEGVPQDYAKAAAWSRRAADQGNAFAQGFLGLMYYYGEGVLQDYAEAATWFRRGADQGNAFAQDLLGDMIENKIIETLQPRIVVETEDGAEAVYYGKGIPGNHVEVVAWYRQAADQGDASAQYLLGFMYYNGYGVPQDYAEAATRYRQAADQGITFAQRSLGDMYFYGNGVPRNYAEAATWYRQAADQGVAFAQRSLGDMYYYGLGVPWNYAEAAAWYRQAADQGNADAQSSLGFMYYDGKGVPQDYAIAETWYRRAADQGDALAQRSLGDIYYYAKGVPWDYAEAAAWYRQAADQGNADAQDLFEELLRRHHDLPMYAYGRSVPQRHRRPGGAGRRGMHFRQSVHGTACGRVAVPWESTTNGVTRVTCISCRKTRRYRQALEELKEWAQQRMEAAGGLVPVAALVERLEGAAPERIGKRRLAEAAGALARLSIGMVPDRLYDLRSPKLGEPVVLFPLPAGITRREKMSAHYPPALLSLVMGAFVAHADGAVSDLERRHLIERVRSSNVLTESEKARLQANLDWMMAVPPDLTPIRRRVKDVGDEVRHGLGRLALAVVGADGVVDPVEVKAIEKLYRILGIEPDGVYRDLHELAATPEPVTGFRPATAGRPAADRSAPIVLDQERVAAIMADTTEVSNVLHAVFSDDADDAEEERPEAQDADDRSDRFAGLDASHRGLAEELMRQPSWTPQEFEKLARRFRLMPAGALETINEWAFERYDAGLIDDGGNIAVNREILDVPAA